MHEHVRVFDAARFVMCRLEKNAYALAVKVEPYARALRRVSMGACGVFAFFGFGRVSAEDIRIWADATGQFKVEARLIRVSDGIAHLERADGKTLAVSIEKLSSVDRTYAVQAAQSNKNELQPGDDRDNRVVQQAPVIEEMSDPRRSWEGPYFFVRKIKDEGIWALSFHFLTGDCLCPYLLREVSCDPTAICLESASKSFRVKLFAGHATIDLPESGRSFPEPSALREHRFGGLWCADGQVVKPGSREWHPKGTDAVRARVQLPASSGSEELRQKLEGQQDLASVLLAVDTTTNQEVVLADLPDSERAAAILDLSLLNAPRWIRKSFGEPLPKGELYCMSPTFLNRVTEAMPADWQELRIAAEQARELRSGQRLVTNAVEQSRGVINGIRAAVSKNPILEKPIEMDVDLFARLSETVFTEIPDALTRTALDIIGDQNQTVKALDEAVRTGDDRDIVLAMASLSDNEREALFILTTTTIFGRVTCDKCKLTHVGMLRGACERVVRSGPDMIKDFGAKEKSLVDELLMTQLKAIANQK